MLPRQNRYIQDSYSVRRHGNSRPGNSRFYARYLYVSQWDGSQMILSGKSFLFFIIRFIYIYVYKKIFIQKRRLKPVNMQALAKYRVT